MRRKGRKRREGFVFRIRSAAAWLGTSWRRQLLNLAGASRRGFWRLRRAIPAVAWIALAVFGVFGFARLVASFWRSTAAPLLPGLRATVADNPIPWWATTLVGLFIVVVLLGYGAIRIYLAFEALLLLGPLGRSISGLSLRRLMREDLLSFVRMLETDMGITRPYAVLLALFFRLRQLRTGVVELRRLSEDKSLVLYLELLGSIAEGWREGVPAAVLVDQVRLLLTLPPPEAAAAGVPRSSASFLRLRGEVIAANVTYLLGDLRAGYRAAELLVEEAKRHDGRTEKQDGRAEADSVGRLPVAQWMVSYPHANSQLFLGRFKSAAATLGGHWQSRYLVLNDLERRELASSLRLATTVDPIASVPRHVLLASAFAASPLLGEAQPRREPIGDPRAWASEWYALGLDHSYEAEKVDRGISLHFTHAYFALYCSMVDRISDPLAILDQIPEDARPVALYVKHGFRGLHHLRSGDPDKAVSALRKAESGQSGNRFLTGIFRPALAAALARQTGEIAIVIPEILASLREAWARAELGRSAFYDAQIHAARSIFEARLGKPGRAEYLKLRALRGDYEFVTKLYFPSKG